MYIYIYIHREREREIAFQVDTDQSGCITIARIRPLTILQLTVARLVT